MLLEVVPLWSQSNEHPLVLFSTMFLECRMQMQIQFQKVCKNSTFRGTTGSGPALAIGRAGDCLGPRV